jgi:hypothetical protein
MQITSRLYELSFPSGKPEVGILSIFLLAFEKFRSYFIVCEKFSN